MLSDKIEDMGSFRNVEPRSFFKGSIVAVAVANELREGLLELSLYDAARGFFLRLEKYTMKNIEDPSW